MPHVTCMKFKFSKFEKNIQLKLQLAGILCSFFTLHFLADSDKALFYLCRHV